LKLATEGTEITEWRGRNPTVTTFQKKIVDSCHCESEPASQEIGIRTKARTGWHLQTCLEVKLSS
jgi:hypothetical protein